MSHGEEDEQRSVEIESREIPALRYQRVAETNSKPQRWQAPELILVGVGVIRTAAVAQEAMSVLANFARCFDDEIHVIQSQSFQNYSTELTYSATVHRRPGPLETAVDRGEGGNPSK